MKTDILKTSMPRQHELRLWIMWMARIISRALWKLLTLYGLADA